MGKIWTIIKVLALIGICVCSYIYGQEIKYSVQEKLLNSLINIAGIIFGVMGLWLGLIYPEKFKSLFKPKSENKNDAGLDDIDKILSAIVYSTLIIVTSLNVLLLAPLLKEVDFLTANKEILRGCLYTLMTFLSLMQLWSLLMIIWNASSLRSNLILEKKKKEIADRLGEV